MEWYYAQDGQQRGPISESDFALLVQSGTIRRSTPVWRTGLSDWTTWGELNGGAPSRESVDMPDYNAPRPSYSNNDVWAAREATGAGPPWEEGNGPALFLLIKTAAALILRPLDFYRGLGHSGGNHISFVAWSGAVVGLVAVITTAALDTSGYGSSVVEWTPLAILCAAILVLVLAPVAFVLGSFLASALFHCGLLILGGADSGFEATQRVVFYTYGVMNLLSIIPILGTCFFPILQPILVILGLSISHDIPIWKAALGVLLPLIIFMFTLFFCFRSLGYLILS